MLWETITAIGVGYVIYSALSYPFNPSIILLSSLAILASIALKTLKWMAVVRRFSIKEGLRYNFSNALSFLPIFILDPIRIKILGGGPRATAEVIWDRFTDAVGLISLAFVLSALRFRAGWEIALSFAGLLGISGILWLVLPKEYKEALSSMKLSAIEWIAIGMLSSAFWILNLYPMSWISSRPAIESVSSMAYSIIVSSLNPLPMGVGSMEIILAKSLGIGAKESATFLGIYRSLAFGIQGVVGFICGLLRGKGPQAS